MVKQLMQINVHPCGDIESALSGLPTPYVAYTFINLYRYFLFLHQVPLHQML